MTLRLTWSPVVHEVAGWLARLVWLLAAIAVGATWLLWQQADHAHLASAALREQVPAMVAAQASQPDAPPAPSPAELNALHQRLQTVRREHAARQWTTNDWLDRLARDMPESVQLTAFQHGPDLASATFTAQADDAAALAGWLLHMERQGNVGKVRVLRQDSRVRDGLPVVRVDVRVDR